MTANQGGKVPTGVVPEHPKAPRGGSEPALSCDRPGCGEPIKVYDAVGQWCPEHAPDSEPSLRERYDADDWWGTLTPSEMVAVWKAHALCPPGCEWPWSDSTCPEHGWQR